MPSRLSCRDSIFEKVLEADRDEIAARLIRRSVVLVDEGVNDTVAAGMIA